MWAGHFEELGAPSENIQIDNDFHTRVTPFRSFEWASLQSEEVATICSQLKPWGCGVLIDYGHIKFGGPDLRSLLQDPGS